MYRQGKKARWCWVSSYSSEISVVVGDVKVQVLHANELGAADETDCKILNESEKKISQFSILSIIWNKFYSFQALKKEPF